jgi:hypothetical protein
MTRSVYSRIGALKPRTTGTINVIVQADVASFRRFIFPNENDLLGDLSISDVSGTITLRVSYRDAKTLGVFDAGSPRVFSILNLVANLVNGHLVLETTSQTEIRAVNTSCFSPFTTTRSLSGNHNVSLVDYTVLEEHMRNAN